MIRGAVFENLLTGVKEVVGSPTFKKLKIA